MAATFNRRIAWFLLGSLLLLQLLDQTSSDQVISAWFASSTGFPWKENFWIKLLFHSGWRLLYLPVPSLLLARGCNFSYVDKLLPDLELAAAAALYCLLTIVLCVVLISLLKHISPSYCPWDLSTYGGDKPMQSRWAIFAYQQLGKCFPSAHAGGAFCGVAAYFYLRPNNPKLANRVLIWILLLGTVSGVAQIARGAHFLSHVLYSAWLCTLVGWLSSVGYYRAQRA